MTDIPIIFSAPMVRALLAGSKTMTRRLAWRTADEGLSCKPSPWQKVKPGDRLWVREAFARNANQLSDDRMDTSPVYRADGNGPALDNGTPLPWKPSIHMPCRLSRLTLIVEALKIEPLQDISEDDARAEGVEPFKSSGFQHGTGQFPYRTSFALLWNSLHGAGSWDANPAVVAITFRVVHQNIDRIAV